MASMDSGLGIVEQATEAPVTTNDSAVETPSTSTTTTNSDSSDLQVIDASSETSTEETEGAETELKNADGSDKSPEEQKAFKAEQSAKVTGKEVTTVEQRNALKALKALDPKYDKVVREMHGSIERWAAAKELLGVGDGSGIVGLKNFLSEAGVKTLPELRQAYAGHTAMAETVAATDQLLYAADPSLSENVLEDMKSNGAEDKYPAVVSNFLDHLRETNEAGFYEVTTPHMVSGLQDAGFVDAINNIHNALASGDTAKAQAILKQVGSWFTGLREEVGDKAKVEKALSEREQKIVARETEGVKAERTKVETGIAENCEKSNNTILGKSLGGFLKMPFFRDFPYDTKVDLGNGIKDRLYAALKADKSYQQSMKTLWGAKIPNRAQMVQVHEDWLRTHGDQIVRDTVTKRYPGYAKGGSSAGKAAAAVTKKVDASKAATQSIATMKPIYVASRPEKLVRDSVSVGGKQYDTNQLEVLQIQGKGFVRTTDGKGLKFVTWRR